MEGVAYPPREGGDDVGLDPRDIYGRAAELTQAGRPFALATVVAVQRPTSARPGAHGIIHPDGSIEGWVGGSCAQPIVVREAIRAIASEEPRLLRLTREPVEDARRGDSILEYVMTCHSGGTMEIYVEPHVPRPELWVAGTTPIASALVALGSAIGFRVSLIDPIAVADDFPAAEAVLASDDLAALEPDASPYVVVATQGQWDEEALVAALRRRVAYVGLVSSPTRASAVRAWLHEEGVPEESVAALRAPCGLDLGATAPEEVAVSILAELVSVRRGRSTFGAAAAAEAVEEPATEGRIVLVDPVCGMTVDRDQVRHIAEHAGVVYAFCSVGCRSRFVKDTRAFLAG